MFNYFEFIFFFSSKVIILFPKISILLYIYIFDYIYLYIIIYNIICIYIYIHILYIIFLFFLLFDSFSDQTPTLERNEYHHRCRRNKPTQERWFFIPGDFSEVNFHTCSCFCSAGHLEKSRFISDYVIWHPIYHVIQKTMYNILAHVKC